MKKPYLDETQRFAVMNNTVIGKFFLLGVKKKVFYRAIYRSRKKVLGVYLIIIISSLTIYIFYVGILFQELPLVLTVIILLFLKFIFWCFNL